MTISCGKKNLSDVSATDTSIDASNNAEIDLLYSGFLLVDSSQVNDFAMTNYYVITNEDDWNSWSSKYTKDFPYYLDDFDWDNNSIVTYAYNGAKDLWNTISNVESVSFEDNTVNIIYDENKTKTYVFNNSQDTKHIAILVIKVEKPSNLSSLESRFLTYKTYSTLE